MMIMFINDDDGFEDSDDEDDTGDRVYNDDGDGDDVSDHHHDEDRSTLNKLYSVHDTQVRLYLRQP